MTFQHSNDRPLGSYSSLAVLLTGNFVTILDLFIVNVALPSIQSDLNASSAELQMIIVAYSVVYGAMLLNGARLGDLFGRRRAFLSGMALFALASASCGFAPSPSILIASRSLQGLGAALLMPQIYASIRLSFEGDERRRAFAIMGAVQGVAGAASQICGGALMALDFGHLGWRLVFFVNLPVAAYALLGGRSFVTETREVESARLDLGGALLGAVAVATALFPATMGREYHWPIWAILGLASSGPLFAAFLFYECNVKRLGGSPIIDPSLFRNRGFAIGMMASFLTFSAISSFSLALTMLLQVGLDRTPLQAAFIFLPSTVAFFVGSLVSSWLARRMPVQASILGMSIFSLGLLIAIIDGFIGGAPPALTMSLVMQGFGQGVIVPLLLNAVLSTVAGKDAGMASGLFGTLQTMGSAFGVTIVGDVLFGMIDRRVEQSSGSSLALSYGKAFAVAMTYNLAAVLLGLVLLCMQDRTKAHSRRSEGHRT